MADPAPITPRIVEAHYREALELAETVRRSFARAPLLVLATPEADRAQVAFCSERLRATSRMMQAVAWLLNRRAFYMGELSEAQLQHSGTLPARMARRNPAHLALLDPELAHIVEETLRFFARLQRLDQGWRPDAHACAPASETLHQHLQRRLTG